MRHALWIASLLAGATAACTGAIGGSDGAPAPSASSPNGGGPSSTTASACTDGIDPGSSPIRRLTRIEYDNTVRDLLGLDLKLAESFPPDQTVLGFDNNAMGLTVTPTLAERYMAVAEQVALAATPKLRAIAGCDETKTGADACAKQLVERLGRRAFRRPLTGEEIDSFVKVFAARPAGASFDVGAQMVVQLMLQSPWFLYRAEIGSIATDLPGVMKLDAHETASRLSYLLWGSMPDDELFAAADADQLSTAEQVAAQARRMMNDPRAKQAVANFHRQWLELDALDEVPKDPKIYPEFDDALRLDLQTETKTFVEQIFWKGEGVEALFTAPYTFANASLAKIYGLPAPSGSGFVQVPTDPVRRIGLLTQPSMLSLHAIAYESSPIFRGKFVREKILCHDLPPPPEGLNVVPPEVDASKSTRERYAQHSADPACKGCHAFMDPIGFSFEHYDGMGKWRDKEGTHAIDSKGELIETDVDGPFEGAVELSKKLAKSEQVRACVVTHWFRFAYGRGETEADRCSVETLKKQFAASKHDMRALLVALTQTDAFRYRKVSK